jgi:hypothetical protein
MELRTASEGDNLEVMKEKVAALQQAVMKIGEALNKVRRCTFAPGPANIPRVAI